MTETSAAKAAFARALPYAYKAPAGTEIIPHYGREIIFNRDLTSEELQTLTSSFPVPGRTLRLIGGYSLLAAPFLYGALWLVILLAAVAADLNYVKVNDEHGISPLLTAGFTVATSIARWVVSAALVIAAAGILVDFRAWKKWSIELSAIWKRYAGRVFLTKELPGSRRSQVETLGGRLDAALKKLDAADPAARQLDTAARQAIGGYIDLPVASKELRRVAQSTSTDGTVQQIREQYEASLDAEVVALQAAEDAVLAVRDYARALKEAAAEQEIITLAKTMAAAGASS